MFFPGQEVHSFDHAFRAVESLPDTRGQCGLEAGCPCRPCSTLLDALRQVLRQRRSASHPRAPNALELRQLQDVRAQPRRFPPLVTHWTLVETDLHHVPSLLKSSPLRPAPVRGIALQALLLFSDVLLGVLGLFQSRECHLGLSCHRCSMVQVELPEVEDRVTLDLLLKMPVQLGQTKPVGTFPLSQWWRSRLSIPKTAHRPAWWTSQQRAQCSTVGDVQQVGVDVVPQEVHGRVDHGVHAQHHPVLRLELPLPELLRVSAEQVDHDLLCLSNPSSLVAIPRKPFSCPPLLRQQPLQQVMWYLREKAAS